MDDKIIEDQLDALTEGMTVDQKVEFAQLMNTAMQLVAGSGKFVSGSREDQSSNMYAALGMAHEMLHHAGEAVGQIGMMKMSEDGNGNA